ncbi:MAG: restriction endonuclease subunit S [Micavibrio sp.]|nr:restriction endonuclease subunit S [Micavibrio sp.]
MSEWQEVKLRDLVHIKHGYAFKGAHISNIRNEHLLLTPGNFEIGGGFKPLNKPKYFHSEYPSDYILSSGDLIVTMTDLSKKGDTLGYAAVVPDDDTMNYLHNQRLGKIEIKKTEVLSKNFLHWLLRSPSYRNEVLASYTGSAVKHTSPTKICAFTFALPEIQEQEEIAAVLDSLDKKIELNLRMNEMLEGTARAIFKSWFVDFDPVHAKAEGLEPEGMDSTTAALFPSTFNPDGLPEGWTQEPVISSAEYINGAAFKNMHFSDEPDAWPVVKIAELKNGVSPQTKFTNTDLGDKYKLDTGDILFSWSGSPDTSIDTFIWTGGKGWLNQHIFKVVNETRAERGFAYWLLKYLKPEFIEVARNKQTTGLGHVTRKDMQWMQYCKPDQPVLDLFHETVGILLDKIENNLIQNQTLATLRDTLLPKLISGELRVDTATEKLKEAVG